MSFTGHLNNQYDWGWVTVPDTWTEGERYCLRRGTEPKMRREMKDLEFGGLQNKINVSGWGLTGLGFMKTETIPVFKSVLREGKIPQITKPGPYNYGPEPDNFGMGINFNWPGDNPTLELCILSCEKDKSFFPFFLYGR